MTEERKEGQHGKYNIQHKGNNRKDKKRNDRKTMKE